MLVPENAAAFLEFADVYGLDDSPTPVANHDGSGWEETAESMASLNVSDSGTDGEDKMTSALTAVGDEAAKDKRENEMSDKGRMQRSNSILREGCMSFVLRYYKEVEGTEEFRQLSEQLKTEVERRRTEFTNVYNRK